MAGDAEAVISGRNYLVYSKTYNTTNAMPADTVDYGDAWTGYTDRGYTIGGLTFSMNITRGEIRVDQEFDPIVRPITGRAVTLGTQLAEMTAANLQLASGLGSVTTTAPSSGVRGHDDLEINSNVTDTTNSWGFDILQPNGEAFRILIYKGLATGTPAPSFTPDNAATTALEITGLVDSSTDPARIGLVRDVLPAA